METKETKELLESCIDSCSLPEVLKIIVQICFIKAARRKGADLFECKRFWERSAHRLEGFLAKTFK